MYRHRFSKAYSILTFYSKWTRALALTFSEWITRSMYSFRKHYNYYDQQEAGKDWAGTKAEYFNAGSNEPRFKGATSGKPLVISEGD